MKSMMKKTTLREIKKSLGRYLAILSIVALGVGFFAGLRITKPAMLDTAQEFLDEHHFFDYMLVSTLGFENEDVQKFKENLDVKDAEGAISQNFLTENEQGVQIALVAHSMTQEVNTLKLSQGRLPENNRECVIDARYSGLQVGDTVTIAKDNEEDTKDLFRYSSYRIVGKVQSPLYVNFERGSTNLLDGKIAGFVYMEPEAFDCDYFTEVYLTYDTGYGLYTDDYNDYIDAKEDSLKKITKATLERRYHSIITEAEDKISDGEGKLTDADSKMADGQAQLENAKAQLDDAEKKLTNGEKKIKDGQSQIDAARTQLIKNRADLNTSMNQLTAVEMTPGDDLLIMQAGLVQAEVELDARQKNLDEAKEELSDRAQEISDAKKEFKEKESEFEDKKQELTDAKQKLENSKNELVDAKDDMKDRKVYVLGRDTNIGYVSFQNDSSIVEGIANVFPIFFFLVAALVCMTTMNRMVEEQRTQIGILKALGYGRMKIMNKYLFYSCSASLAGGVMGFFVGCYLFPMVIWRAYGIMYDFSGTINFVFDPILAVAVVLVALICAGGATYFSCYYELHSVPAELIRPKAPKNGKRILLERIPAIWKHMNFMQKVSTRNIIRYKKRFFMMLLGISGCTALLVTGFGIEDSISNIIDLQYEEIEKFDATLNLDETLHVESTGQDSEIQQRQDLELDKNWTIKDFSASISNIIERYCVVDTGELDVVNGKVTKSVTRIVPQEPQQLGDFIKLCDTHGNMLNFPEDDEVILSDKTAFRLGVKKGSHIILQDADLNQITVAVSGICKNYVNNYVYMNGNTYEELTGKAPEYKTVYACYKDDVSVNQVTKELLELEHVSSVSNSNVFRERFSNMIGSLNYVVLLVIICAGALAFIVLYNLTNINITERVREIATIKVLGFFPAEVNNYVLRENMVLTGLGALVGLPLGKALHAFVMSKVDIDFLNFPIQIYPATYLYSFLLTFVFAMVVNLFMTRKLAHIDMAESLKSIE